MKSLLFTLDRLTVEITSLVNEMKKGEENESHLSIQLTAERKGMDMANKSLTSCETLLKKFIDKNDGLKCENAELGENVRFLFIFFCFS